MDGWKNFSEIFYNFSLGLGALGGGFFGFVKGISSILSGLWRYSYVSKVKKQYPRRNLGKTFLIGDSPKHPGTIYVLDLKKKERFWLQTGETLVDCGFTWGDSERYTQEYFDKFKEGTPIYVR